MIIKVRNNYLPLLIIVAIGILYIMLTIDMPFLADDLHYYGQFARKFGDIPVFGALRKMRGHWLDVNGRFADMANVLFLYHIPHWLLSVICGVMVSAFLWFMDLWCFGRRKGFVTLQVALIAIVIFSFAWWDAFMLFVVQMNYVWTMAWVLATLYIMLCTDWTDRRYTCWPLAFVALLAGWMHEAIGPSVAFAFFVYFLLNRDIWRQCTRGKRIMLAAFFIGAFLTIASPGIWGRLGSSAGHNPDDPYFVLILKNCFYVAILAVIVIVEALAHPCRIKDLSRAPWFIFALAAFGSAFLSTFSGMVGRAGWCAQSFAVIAIFQWMLTYRLPNLPVWLATSISSLLTVLIILHLGAFTYWQLKMERQVNEVIAEFEKNPEKCIFMDYIRPGDVPWYVLGKTLGVFDENDWGFVCEEKAYRGDGVHSPVILPEKLRNFDFKGLSLPYRDKDFILLPNPDRYDGPNIEREIEGRVYLLVPFENDGRTMFYARLRYLAPAERPVGPVRKLDIVVH